jgi:transposase
MKLPRANKRLFRAYLLKEALADILDGKHVHVARRKLGEWTSWAARSRLKPFRKLSGTVRRYEEGILAYISSRLSNGHTEAFNGKARTITRRAYGLHSASALIALLKLCCSGIELMPVTLRPGFTDPIDGKPSPFRTWARDGRNSRSSPSRSRNVGGGQVS